jgi:hypothetical protein
MKKFLVLVLIVSAATLFADEKKQWSGVCEYSLMYEEIQEIFEKYELVDVEVVLELTERPRTEYVDGSEFEHAMPWVCQLVEYDGVNKTTYTFFR